MFFQPPLNPYNMGSRREAMMEKKHETLLRLLLEKSPSTAANLASSLGISVRTVKSYVRDINHEAPGTISSSSKGYSVDCDHADKLLAETGPSFPADHDERVAYLINRLLNETAIGGINQYDLCDELYISLSTLKTDLRSIRARAGRYDLDLVTENSAVSIRGAERNKRHMMSDLLYEKSGDFVSLGALQDAFSDLDMQAIRSSILDVLDRHHFFANDYSLLDLVAHVSIALNRISRGNRIPAEINASRLPDSEEADVTKAMADELAAALEGMADVHFSQDEKNELALLILSHATAIDYKALTVSNLESYVGSSCLALVRYLITYIDQNYGIDLSVDEFLIRFALHVHSLLIRSRNGRFSKNPLTNSIKASSPLIYDVSVSVSAAITEKTGITVNEDEIAYIAFHLGSAIQAQRLLLSHAKALLYCPNYYDMDIRLIEDIDMHLGDRIVVVGVITDESDLDTAPKADLILSVVPFPAAVSVPVIAISPFLDERSSKRIEDAAIGILQKREQEKFIDSLKRLMPEELFERAADIHTQEQCIAHMANRLESLGYVDGSFEDAVREREQLSSTAFGAFAIPHSMHMQAAHTGIYVLITNRPLLWGTSDVNLIIMLCFSRSERSLFNEMFERMTETLSQPANVRTLTRATTREQFIDLLAKLG